VRVCVVLGSGGHTSEMMGLMKALDLERYSPRSYVIAATDSHSATKMKQFEDAIDKGEYSVRAIPRSREVGQSYFTSIWTTLFALWYAFKIVWQARPELILVNGPGTCVPICVVGRLFGLFCISRAKIIYVESVCRVETLSLTGKISYYLLAHHVLVQWPQLADKYTRATYMGRLV